MGKSIFYLELFTLVPINYLKGMKWVIAPPNIGELD